MCRTVPKKRVGVYPGTFDPLTNGHLSLIMRATAIFDTVIVAIAADTTKSPLFTLEERISLAAESVKNIPGVVVEGFEGLLVDYVLKSGSHTIIRGLRAVSDFEYEFQLALMNRKLDREVQTVFLMTDYQWLYISSTIVKNVASLNGDVKDLVPPPVWTALRHKYGFDEK